MRIFAYILAFLGFGLVLYHAFIHINHELDPSTVLLSAIAFAVLAGTGQPRD